MTEPLPRAIREIIETADLPPGTHLFTFRGRKRTTRLVVRITATEARCEPLESSAFAFDDNSLNVNIGFEKFTVEPLDARPE
jgi:hypothetical protein